MPFVLKDPAMRVLYTLMGLIAMVAIGAAVFAAAPVFAEVSAAELTVAARFTDRQRELIVAYTTQSQSVGAAPDGGKGKKGKSKQKGLPPGIAMNLARGKTLPPGIAKQQLPAPLVAQLPPPPRGHEIVVVDGRVLLVEIATQVIRDRLEDIVFR
jgi:Ni/Co efflux regulator RcnB